LLLSLKESTLLKQVENHTVVLQGLFLSVLTLLIYSPAFHGGFIFDDINHLVSDRRLQTFAGLIKIWLYPTQDYQHQYYPLTSTTFWLMHQLWGFNTLGFHLVNVSMHALNALLLWRLLALLKVPGSYWAALLFAVHPVNVQSVAWIIELKNVQSCFFYLAAAIAFMYPLLKYGKVRWSWYIAALLLFVCALLSKAATSSLPIGLLLLLFWKRRQTFWRDLLWLLPFIVMGGMFAGYVKNLEEQFSGNGLDLGLNTSDRWVLLGQTIWFYATQLVLPVDMRFVYPKWRVDATQWLQWLPTCGLLVVVVLFVKMRKLWGNGPLAGLLYFCLAIGPLAFVSVAYMRFSYVANHWVYWASMGFITLMATALVQCLTRRKLRVAVMLIVVCGMGLRSWYHAHLYEGSIPMWRHVLAEYPTFSSAHLNLANFIRADDPAGAFSHYQLALMYNPYSYRSLIGMGTLFLQTNKPVLCRFYTAQAILYDPHNPFFWYQNARAKIVLGQVHEGQKILEKVLSKKPDQFESIVLLAHVYLIENRLADAAKLADQAHEIDPEDQQTLGIVGMVQARQGNNEQAKENLIKAIVLNPSFNDGLLTLAIINHQQGNLGVAQMYYKRVLALDENSVAAHEKLGLTYWEQSKWDLALEHCGKAYELDPTRILAGRRAADAMGHLGQLDEATTLFRKLHAQSPNSPQLINELAWVLAVQGDSASLPLAQQAAKLTDDKVALVLDTLGAAYAASGDFTQAIHWTTQALAITHADGEADLQTGIQKRLALYQQNQRQTTYAR
jgi:tetratricopeptide (TPR) repeat protein